MSYNFEIALRQYIATSNGNNNITPAEFKSLFDNLYHKDFTFLSKDGDIITREVYGRQAYKFASSGATKLTLIHFRKIGKDCIDVKLGAVSGDEEQTFRTVSALFSGKVVRSKEIDESPTRKIFVPGQLVEAKCTNFVYKWHEFGTFQKNMWGAGFEEYQVCNPYERVIIA